MWRFWCFFLGGMIFSMAQEKYIDVEPQPLKIHFSHPKMDKETLKYSFRKMRLQQQHWYSYNRIRLNTSQVYFSNWKAGGESSVSALVEGRFRRRYSRETFFWDNELYVSYGVNIQQGEKLRKTDDQIDYVSSIGYRTGEASSFYYSLKTSLSTQMSNGYAYPDRETPVSKPFSPGYFVLGLGIEYAPSRFKINAFASPVSLKTTMVFDQNLADLGSFGVEAAQYDTQGNKIKDGENLHMELGFQFSGNWQWLLWENIEMNHRFNFYGDYLKNFGNIDVDWEVSLDMKINNYVQARLGAHLKYDDDIKFLKGVDSFGQVYSYGARAQLKQILGIGLTYSFK